MTARRVGLTPTPRSVSSASGWIAAATSQNAAAETSPGTRSLDRTHRRPSFETDRHRPAGPAARPRSRPATPRARSIRSVWSRVATASRTVVRPSARSPASRIADLTWALGTGVATSTARSGVRPTTVTGGRESSDRAWSTAPIARSGSMIRATGRRRNESSPSRTLRNGSPARIPANSRRLVPELPQSRSAAGSRSPSTPGETTRYDRRCRRRRRRPCRSTVAPSAAQTAAVERTSAPSPAPVDPALARGQRREHQRPVADRLVAGQPQLAAQAAAPGG